MLSLKTTELQLINTHIACIPAHLDRDVPAAALVRVPVEVPVQAGGAQVGVTLPQGLAAGARVGRALALAPTNNFGLNLNSFLNLQMIILAARPAVGAVPAAVAELLAEVVRLSAAAHLVAAGLPRVVARAVREVVLPQSVLALALEK